MTHSSQHHSLSSWLEAPVSVGMACPATEAFFSATEGEGESDYGSEFSPEEEEIVNRLLIASPEPSEATEDNPIVTDVEYNDPVQTVRVLRVIGREGRRETVGNKNIPSEPSPATKTAVQSRFQACKLSHFIAA